MNTTPHFHRDAERFLKDEERVGWHDKALYHLRTKRDLAADDVPDWEALRAHAAAVKAHVLDYIPELLEGFLLKARAAGWIIHFAGDAAELRTIVHGILKERGAKKVVKSKSMLTEECGLNPHLEGLGIEVTDTDLGERIVQLRHEPPSHIVVPAIHLRRREVGDLFHRTIGTAAGEDDPTRLAHAARRHLRSHFLEADAGITGVNFAVAETGSIIVCTNEGNADLGTVLPRTHIACMGAEKLIPQLADAAVFLRLLARSATGQPITAYTTHLTGPDPLRPDHQAHLVIVDAGRSQLNADLEHRRSLSCIRCGACLNTCPVYRRASGHSYGLTVPGPIGSVLGPSMAGEQLARELPFASTLCGSCTNVCPVKIDLHDQLLSWRRRLAEKKVVSFGKRLAMRIGAFVMSRPWLYRTAGALARSLWPLVTSKIPGSPLLPWLAGRALPPAPKQAFRARWKAGHQGEGPPKADAGEAPPSEVRVMDERAFLDRFRRPGAKKAGHPGAYPPPAYPATWERFGRVLASVGGRFTGPVTRAALPAEVAKVIAEIPGRCVASAAAAPLLAGVTGWDRAPDAASAPHKLADVELGILTAELAVAENGALLTSATTLPERGLAFLPQHLVILVPGAGLLPDLVTAQARLPKPPPHHLTWISGPSKTADIEQTLVIGAHGARSLTVIAYTD